MRRALAVAAVASVIASTVIFFACSDDTGVTPGAGEGGVASDDGGAPADDGGSLYDGPVSPTGCRLKTTNYRAGTKAENVPRTDVSGTAQWANLEGALSEDGQFATVTLNDGQESDELRVSDFQLNVPDSAETWGIEVELKRQAPDGGIQDSRVDLGITGKTAEFKYLKGTWPRTIVGTHHYGQPVDTWKVDLYPSDVNPNTFSARLWIKKDPDAGTGPAVALVDSLKVAVWYCPK